MSQQPIDYQGPVTRDELRRKERKAGVVIGVGLGAVVTWPALFLAMISAGAGHGHYGFARGLFPVPMCVAIFVTDSIKLPSLVLALGQFPLYGAVLGYCAATSGRALLVAVTIILLVHLVAFAACSGPSAFS